MKNRLVYAASDSNADLLHLTGFSAPDPFAWFSLRGRSAVLLSDLEVDRGRREARVDEVLPLSQLEKEARIPPKARDRTARLLVHVLSQARVRSVEVPHDFPLGLAESLRRRGISVRPVKTPFVPQRLLKREDEIAFIQQAQRVAESGMARAKEILRASQPNAQRLLKWNGKPLTSEILQGEINACIARAGGHATGTIVAGGDQACDPHERGSGPLRAHEPILVDIFPRITRTGYWGDITRTFVRGQPAPEATRLIETVRTGQERVLAQLRDGCDGARVQQELRDWFATQGFPTEQRHGRHVGFFHGVGHGVGLEIHEAPRFASGPLEAGTVITIEPGLYYPGIGACRIEDLVVITPTGFQNLTRFPKQWRL